MDHANSALSGNAHSGMQYVPPRAHFPVYEVSLTTTDALELTDDGGTSRPIGLLLDIADTANKVLGYDDGTRRHDITAAFHHDSTDRSVDARTQAADIARRFALNWGLATEHFDVCVYPNKVEGGQSIIVLDPAVIVDVGQTSAVM